MTLHRRGVEEQRALTEAGARKAAKVAALEAAARRWLAANPGETAKLCAEATGVPHSTCMRIAKETGYVSRKGSFA